MDEFNEKLEKALKEFKEKVEERQEYNIKCLKIIKNMVFSQPDLRFGQILAILKLDGDIFNEESVDTYERIIKNIK
jgi:hypothetical protein